MTSHPTIAAFFDVDHTILKTSSSFSYVQYMRRQGQMSSFEVLRLIWHLLLYRMALIDFPQVQVQLPHMAAGQSETETRAICDRWFREAVVQHVSKDAQECIEHHRAQGHRPVLLSAAMQYVNRPLAEHLGLGDDFLCTHLEVKDGLLTGRLIEPPCYGAGKLYWARQFAAEQGIDLAASYFYTDSHSDLPTLHAVGHPVAVNPSAHLRRHAQSAGWPILTFR